MRKNFYFACLLFFAVLSVITGCSKKNDAPVAVTPTAANIVGTYKISAYFEKIGTGPQINVLDSIQVCQRDDEFNFKADSIYDHIDAGTVCNPPGNGSGTWELESSTTMKLDGDEYAIKSFDGKTLIIILTQTNPYSSPPITEIIAITLTKQ